MATPTQLSNQPVSKSAFLKVRLQFFLNDTKICKILRLILLISSLFQAVAFDGDAVAKQPDGAVVADAFFNAQCVPVPSGVQRVVLKPCYWNDRGQRRVQRDHHQTFA